MAAFNRPTEATYEVHENVTIDTNDHEDHTFCGIMFPIKCKELLPLDHAVIHSVAVRGHLGPLTVWVSNDDNEVAPPPGGVLARLVESASSSNRTNRTNTKKSCFRMNKKYWTKVYERTHAPSVTEYCELDLRSGVPSTANGSNGSNRGGGIILKPGQVRAVYIHSTLPGDEAIVYDNNRDGSRTYDDNVLSILPGRAHVASEAPFSHRPIWGWGSNAWRDNREFVGRIKYGTVYQLWNPSRQTAIKFGTGFQTLVRTLHLCQRKWSSPFSTLPDDCIFYILNMCRWDWANDTTQKMKELKQRRTLRLRCQRREEQQQRLDAADIEAKAATTNMTATADTQKEITTGKPRNGACCRVDLCSSNDNEEILTTRNEGNAEDFQAAEEDHQEESESEDENEDDEDENEDEMVEVLSIGDGGEQGWMEEWNSDSEDDDSEDSGDDAGDDASDWDPDVFVYRDDDSDASDDGEGANISGEAVRERDRRAWVRRQFSRVYALRALANVEGNEIVELDF